MTTKIKIWQIKNKKLTHIDTTMAKEGRKEFEDLEEWIRETPEILGQNLLLIGEQVHTNSGPLDFLAIDETGNIVIIELKRDQIPRGALTQAIDYASDIASWDIDILDEKCRNFTNSNLKDYIKKNFPNEDINWNEISINQLQRILIVGIYITEKLERMITWLSEKHEVLVNAITISYGKTESGDEILAATTIIAEEKEKESSKKLSRKIWKSTLKDHYERLNPPYGKYLKELVEELGIEPKSLSGSGFHLINGKKKIIVATYIKSKLEFQFTKSKKEDIENLLEELGISFKVKIKSDNQSYKEINPKPSIDYKEELGLFDDVKTLCKRWLELM